MVYNSFLLMYVVLISFHGCKASHCSSIPYVHVLVDDHFPSIWASKKCYENSSLLPIYLLTYFLTRVSLYSPGWHWILHLSTSVLPFPRLLRKFLNRWVLGIKLKVLHMLASTLPLSHSPTLDVWRQGLPVELRLAVNLLWRADWPQMTILLCLPEITGTPIMPGS